MYKIDKKWWMGCLVTTLILITGCHSIGPNMVSADRFDYNTAIANSWKEQTLLNIVKLRYSDMPLFVEVASVVSGYTLERSVNINGTLSSATAMQGDFLGMGASGRFTDRPTITYSPLTGKKFNQNFLTPLPPKSLLFLIQSGWPADMILQLTVDSVNGLRSRSLAGTNVHSGDADFYEFLRLFRELQKTGNIGMRILTNKSEKQTTVIFFHKKEMSPDQKAHLLKMYKLLKIKPNSEEIVVNYGSIAQNDSELMLLSRSMLQIMIKLASMIDVPQEHVDKGYTVPTVINGTKNVKRMMTVKCGDKKPEHALTSIYYHDTWFWIEDSDFYSKRTFSFLMILFSLTETGGDKGLPLITIPAG
jgi:hypothetical protein